MFYQNFIKNTLISWLESPKPYKIIHQVLYPMYDIQVPWQRLIQTHQAQMWGCFCHQRKVIRFIKFLNKFFWRTIQRNFSKNRSLRIHDEINNYWDKKKRNKHENSLKIQFSDFFPKKKLLLYFIFFSLFRSFAWH
jgi:hypothetical protein